jgi:hypothetical protein
MEYQVIDHVPGSSQASLVSACDCFHAGLVMPEAACTAWAAM